jgi:hypothetical protein
MRRPPPRVGEDAGDVLRDWLGRDVLPGYRDLEADPDLEAYFADRDVQAYLDELDSSPAPAEARHRAAGSADRSLTAKICMPARNVG